MGVMYGKIMNVSKNKNISPTTEGGSLLVENSIDFNLFSCLQEIKGFARFGR